MGNELLTRAECNALRGIAIIGIVLHNYCHWLRGIVRENEYQFFESNVEGLNGVLAHPDALLPIHLLSFFGHYGVPLFLFLSAYGLVRKYEGPTLHPVSQVAPLPFIWHHYQKLFKMMFAGFVAFVVIDTIMPRGHHYRALDIVAQLGMFNNVLPNPDQIIWPGPYWFFGLMLQLYVVYRLLLYRRHWGWTVALMAVCTLAQLLFGPESEELNRYRYNFMGGMLPFGLGLLYGRLPKTLPQNYNWLFCLISLILIYTEGQTFFGWMLVPLFVCSAGFTLVKLLPGWLLRGLEWMGGISAALFVCHPIARRVFIGLSYRGDLLEGLILYVIASIALALLFKRIQEGAPKVLQRNKEIQEPKP